MDKIIDLPKRFVDFIKEAYAELKRVTWLGKEDVIKATAGVFMIVIFFAMYVGLLDFLISRLVGLFIGAR